MREILLGLVDNNCVRPNVFIVKSPIIQISVLSLMSAFVKLLIIRSQHFL